MRYVVTDELWGHLFEGFPREMMCQFVFDRHENRLVAALMEAGWGAGTLEFREMAPDQAASLEDSLVNANPDALADPEAWGLSETDEVPDWAADTVNGGVKP